MWTFICPPTRTGKRKNHKMFTVSSSLYSLQPPSSCCPSPCPVVGVFQDGSFSSIVPKHILSFLFLLFVLKLSLWPPGQAHAFNDHHQMFILLFIFHHLYAIKFLPLDHPHPHLIINDKEQLMCIYSLNIKHTTSHTVVIVFNSSLWIPAFPNMDRDHN